MCITVTKAVQRLPAFHMTYLHAAFDNIKGADSSVGEAAGEDASNHALGVVASVVNVTHPRVVFRLFSLKCIMYLNFKRKDRYKSTLALQPSWIRQAQPPI